MSNETRWPQWSDTIVPAEWQAAPTRVPKHSKWAPLMNVIGISLGWLLDMALARAFATACILAFGVALVAAWAPMNWGA